MNKELDKYIREYAIIFIFSAITGFFLSFFIGCGTAIPQFEGLSPEAESAAFIAFDKLEICGMNPKPNFTIKGITDPGVIRVFTNCGRAILGGTRIYLNEQAARSTCGLEMTLGHEMLHLLGYSHATPQEAKEFGSILQNCGFERGE